MPRVRYALLGPLIAATAVFTVAAQPPAAVQPPVASGPDRITEPVAVAGVILDQNLTAAVVAEGAGKTAAAAKAAAVEAALAKILQRLGGDPKSAVGDRDAPLPLRELYAAVEKAANVLTLPPGPDGQVQVRLTARVSAKEYAAAQKDKKPAPPGIDGAQIAGDIRARRQRAAEAHAWASLVAQGYPYGCFKVELVEYAEVVAQRTQATATFRVKVRYEIDATRYAEFAAWLSRALTDAADTPPDKFALSYSPLPGRLAGNYGVIGQGRGVAFSEFVRPTPADTRSVTVFALVEGVAGPAGGGAVTANGRAFVLDVPTGEALFKRMTEGRVKGEVQFLDKTGRAVASFAAGDELGFVTRQSLPYRDPRGPAVAGDAANLFVCLPTIKKELYRPSEEVEVLCPIGVGLLEQVAGKPRVGFAPPR